MKYSLSFNFKHVSKYDFSYIDPKDEVNKLEINFDQKIYSFHKDVC